MVALLGENGAGKSTLIKILAGVYQPTAGTIRLGGDVFARGISSAEARAHGLSFVHQDLGLVESLSVAENIAHVAGFQRRYGFISWRSQARFAFDLLERWEIDLHPATPVHELEAAERALVAVARAVATDARVIVFDEPTASLPRHDVELLYGAVDRLRAGGVAILYVTHRLGEVARLADRAVVLRDGEVVGTVDMGKTTERELIELIVGGSVDHDLAPRERAVGDEVVLVLEDVACAGVHDVSLTLKRGETLALVGLVGAGHRSVGRIVAGVEPTEAGEMALGGEPYRPRTPLDAQRRGVVHVPSDRLGEGGFPTLDTATNYALHDRVTTALASARRERAEARMMVDDWGVVPRSPEATFSSLSGGNQQKVILAKWMTQRPAVLVAEEPTAGIDVGTRAAIYERLAQAAADGASVLLMSSDADEVAAIADRAIVFAHGAPKTELRRSELSAARIVQECFSG